MIKYCMNQMTSREWPFDKDVEYYASQGVPAITPQKFKLGPYGVDKGMLKLVT